jgi:hypothetical protein
MPPPYQTASGVRKAYKPIEEFKGDDQFEQDDLY